MNFCYFVSFRPFEPAGNHDESALLSALEPIFGDVPGLVEARVHTPASAHDPMLDDGAPPALVLQLFFGQIDALESALRKSGPLSALATAPVIEQLGRCAVDQQAMLTRRFVVPNPQFQNADTHHCTYLVRYEGPARDTNAWLTDYLEGHPPLMAQLPGIRQFEIFTRIDWCGDLPWRRSDDMQRNQVVFDDASALNNALNSPLRQQMRKHYDALPAFEGAVTHFPVLTQTWPR